MKLWPGGCEKLTVNKFQKIAKRKTALDSSAAGSTGLGAGGSEDGLAGLSGFSLLGRGYGLTRTLGSSAAGCTELGLPEDGLAGLSGFSLLGRGALSRVHLCSQRGAPAALKVYRKSQLVYSRQTDRLAAELRALRLACQGEQPVELVGFRGAGHTENHVYLLFDAYLVRGASITLDRLLRSQRTGGRDRPLEFPEETAAYVVACVLRAVSHLHARCIAHRDVKPGNLVIRATGQPTLIDLGAAALLPAPDTGSGSSTGLLTDLCGTLAYMYATKNCIYIHIHACIYIYIFMYVCKCIYLYIFIYIYIYK